ncbi:unnamed protein product [marine sediment metagenome]|uniref:Uncharacterized protein n=1 Tax=marine sediment metagenome TaxID=412755 RepID=X1PX17_9ZZZZ
MKIKLLGYEAEVEWISPKQTSSFVSHDSIESIGVWFTFDEPVSSTIGFGIEIPPREYTEEEFKRVIIAGGERALQGIIDQHKKEKLAAEKRDEQRKKLNKLVADLGEKLDIPFRLNTK